MKQIFSILMALCLVLGMAVPAFAADTGMSPEVPIGASDTATSTNIPDDPIEELPSQPDTENPIPEDTDESGPPASALGQSCPAAEIAPLSGFDGDGSEFFTRIRLTVTDRSGNPIAGAVYGLYRMDSGELVDTLTTDSFGVAVSIDVPVDTDYYLIELSTPEGFLPNEETKEIYLTDACAPSRVDVGVVYDSISGKIKIIKTDEDGIPLSGAGFYLYRQTPWELVETLVTGSDGTAVTGDLPYGQYEIYEYDVPEGYSGSGWDYIFLSQHEVTEEITIVNYKATGSVRIYKTGNDERKIQGAVFAIHNADTDQRIEDITTNNSGYAYSSSLLLGNYYAVEKSVPAPYKLDDSQHGFTIGYNGQYVYLNITNEVDGESGRVKVIKTDDKDNPLSRVTFGLFRAWDNKRMETLTTAEDGTAESDLLIPGDYYLVEESGRDGYEMSTDPTTFTIDGSSETVEKTVVNPKIRIFGKVKVIKQDDAAAPIEGVRFGLYCSKGNLLEELVTGADGTSTSGILNEGTGYYLQELAALPGYLSDPTAQYLFDITQNEVIIPVTVTNPRITGAVKICKDDGNGNPLPGVVFGIFQGEQQIAELATDEDGTAVSDTLYYGDYELRELSTVEGYELIDTPIPFSITEQDVVLEIAVSNPLILGSITITKTDTEENQLAGAVFGLYNSGGQKLAELITSEDGTATHTGLPQGSYFFKELAAPEGFVLTDEIIPFAIETQGQTVALAVANSQGFGMVKIIKTGENDVPLSGVTFEIYHTVTEEKVGELVTNADGIAEAELPLGRYYLVEIATAEGYRLPEGRISFALTEDGATVEMPIQNQKEPEPVPEIGYIRLVKKSEDGKLLPGAVFGIYRADTGAKVGELTTGSDGTATSKALPALESGYYLQETTAPSGYKLSTDKTAFVVKNNETTEVTVINKAADSPSTPDPDPKPGKLLIIKKAEKTGTLLKGAVFGVYRDSDDTLVKEITTDRYGEAALELTAGDYYLRELEAPAGYKLDSGRLTFRIKSSETKEITITNKSDAAVKPGTLLLIKKSEDGKLLSGAVFGVYDADTREKLDEITTDRYGEAAIELPAGSYYLRELKAPDKYALSGDKISFKLEAGKTKEITVTNKLLEPEKTEDMGTLRLIKKAAGTGKPLAGAVFEVFSLSGNKKVGEIVSGADGTADLELSIGEYYLLEKTAPTGYKLETAKILFRVKLGATVKVEVTNMKDDGTQPVQPVDPGTPGISIPKTGEAFPTLNYVLAGLLFALAGLCGWRLWQSCDRKHRAALSLA